MLPFKKILFWALPLIMFISGQPLKGWQNEGAIVISAPQTVDVCTPNRQVVVIVSLGKIEKSDSLLVFDIELKFDQSKIRFDQILTLNTLSEQFSSGIIKTTGDFSKKGFARASGGTITDNPAAGDKPLIGFLGVAEGDCADTIDVELSYIDFSEEFKKRFNDTINAQVILKEGLSPNRTVDLSFLKS